MTFTEAAAQVLRLVGKPLHYKEITDVAIEKNLLSHVGKSPEVTMGARLAALVKKNDKDNPLVRLKPGVFALREWDQKTIDKGLADRTPALDRIGSGAVDGSEAAPGTPAERAAPDAIDEEVAPPDEEELNRAKMAARASELFAPEDDDNLPLFGAEEPAAGAVEEDDLSEREGGGRRRRRRRRGGRNGNEERGGDELPAYTVSDVPADLVVAEGGEEAPPREAREREVRDVRENREAREGREGGREAREGREGGREAREGREGGREAREGREGGREAREGREGGREARDRDGRDRDRERRPDRGGPIDELAGRDLADALANLLSTFDRSGGPVGFQKLAETAQRRGRLVGDLQQAQALVGAALRADNLRRAAAGQRSRFRVQGNRVALTEWLLDGELLRLEREIGALVERYRDASRRILLRRIQELPPRALGELILLVLERVGITNLEAVRRAGAPGSELHLAGTSTGPAGDVRVAILVRRDGREVGRERVTELRGALHHYGPANAAWIVTTGQVLSGAREEAAAVGAAPCTLIDGVGLARLCEEQGVAVTQTRITLAIPDIELLDNIRAG